MRARTFPLVLAIAVSACLHIAAAAFFAAPERSGAKQAGLGAITVSLGPTGLTSGARETPPEPALDVDRPATEAPQDVAPEPPVSELAEPMSQPAMADLNQTPPAEPDVATETRALVEVAAVAASRSTARIPPRLAEPAEPTRAVEPRRTIQPTRPRQPDVATPPAFEPRPDPIEELRLPERPSRTAALAPGVAGSGAADSYYARIQTLLERQKRYPRRARLRGEEGVVLLRFVVDRSGEVSNIAIAESSGHELLDEEARRMVNSAQPLPVMPAEIREARIEIRVPVRFFLR